MGNELEQAKARIAELERLRDALESLLRSRTVALAELCQVLDGHGDNPIMPAIIAQAKEALNATEDTSLPREYQEAIDSARRQGRIPPGPHGGPETIDERHRKRIYDAIDRERTYQIAKWGDHPHAVGEWLLIVEGELDEAKCGWRKGKGDADALCEVLQVIAVGVACLEAHGIVERNDPWPR